MTSQLNRDEILDSIHGNVQDRNMIKHMLATEAIMRAVARKLGEDEQEWGLTGLIHDIDVELVEGDMGSHGKLGSDLARELGANETMARSGLITAAALVRPDKLSGLTSKSVMKRFREKSFAAGVNREQVAQCQEIGVELEEFVALGIEAMQKIASQLGL
jgi:putative nucleotidyltransferase with HDIG domain